MPVCSPMLKTHRRPFPGRQVWCLLRHHWEKGEKTVSERRSHLSKVTEQGPEPVKCGISHRVCKAPAATSSEVLVNVPHGLRVHERQLTSYSISRRFSQRLCLGSVLASCQLPLKLCLRLLCFSPSPPAWTGAVAADSSTWVRSCSSLLSSKSVFLKDPNPTLRLPYSSL